MCFFSFKKLTFTYGVPSSDNFVFKLCYRWTVLLLVAFSFVITCRLWFGNSFSCRQDSFPQHYLNTKCYDHSVYTLPSKLIIKDEEKTVTENKSEDFRRYQSFYSWVNLLFLVHAFNFYLPHLLWKSYERGYIRRLTSGVQTFFDNENKRDSELYHLAKFIITTRGKHQLYTGMYIFIEFFNFVICLLHTVWLVYFFDVTGVPDFFPHYLATWSDFKNFYFPSEGFCSFIDIGASGLPMRYKAMCLLPLNGLYMYTFLFLFFWYILLTVLSGLVLIYRSLLSFSGVRIFFIGFLSPLSDRLFLSSVCRQFSYSDWFFLSRVRQAMMDVDFAKMTEKLSHVSEEINIQSEEDKAFPLSEVATKKLYVSPEVAAIPKTAELTSVHDFYD